MSGTPPSAPKKVLSFGADWTLFLNFWGYLNFCEIFPVLTGKVQTAAEARVTWIVLLVKLVRLA